jgi:hypothetical protein
LAKCQKTDEKYHYQLSYYKKFPLKFPPPELSST